RGVALIVPDVQEQQSSLALRRVGAMGQSIGASGHNYKHPSPVASLSASSQHCCADKDVSCRTAPTNHPHNEIQASTAGQAITPAPRIISETPAVCVSTSPCFQVLSTKRCTKMATIHSRFMRPTTSSTEVSAQQQPRQNNP